MKMYFAGPGSTFTFHRAEDGSDPLVFTKKGPGMKVSSVEQEVTDDEAMDLLHRRHFNFHCSDPADLERLIGKKDEESPISPSQLVIESLENSTQGTPLSRGRAVRMPEEGTV